MQSTGTIGKYDFIRVEAFREGTVLLKVFQHETYEGKYFFIILNTREVNGEALEALIEQIASLSESEGHQALEKNLVATIWADISFPKNLLSVLRRAIVNLGEHGFTVSLSGMSGINVPVQTISRLLRDIAGVELEAHTELLGALASLNNNLKWWSEGDIQEIARDVVLIARTAGLPVA